MVVAQAGQHLLQAGRHLLQEEGQELREVGRELQQAGRELQKDGQELLEVGFKFLKAGRELHKDGQELQKTGLGLHALPTTRRLAHRASIRNLSSAECVEGGGQPWPREEEPRATGAVRRSESARTRAPVGGTMAPPGTLTTDCKQTRGAFKRPSGDPTTRLQSRGVRIKDFKNGIREPQDGWRSLGGFLGSAWRRGPTLGPSLLLLLLLLGLLSPVSAFDLGKYQ